jgi:hypothetical protein
MTVPKTAMKIFLSWSGEKSKAVATLLCDWIRCVLQVSRPWISTRDIDRGALWFTEISEQLKDTSIGIICLTQDNKTRPWLLFEAGALTKGLSSSRVCPFLVDLQSTDVDDPLAQFNHTFPTHESMSQLVETLNKHMGDHALDPRIVAEVFETYWPKFEKDFKKIMKAKPAAPAPPKEERELLEDIVGRLRLLSKRMFELEMAQPKTVQEPQETSDLSLAVASRFVAQRLAEGASRDEIYRELKSRNLTGDVAKGLVDLFVKVREKAGSPSPGSIFE